MIKNAYATRAPNDAPIVAGSRSNAKSRLIYPPFDLITFQKNLKVGDKVIASGIVGIIREKTGDFCKIEICNKVVVEMLISAITDVAI